MTNKEAIKVIEHLYEAKPIEAEEALDLAIKALEIVDDANQTIYRNEDCDRKIRCYDYIGYHCAGCNGAKDKKGEWIEENSEVGALGIKYSWFRCNQCGWDNGLVIPKNFCPNCGADMRKGEEE